MFACRGKLFTPMARARDLASGWGQCKLPHTTVKCRTAMVTEAGGKIRRLVYAVSERLFFFEGGV